MIIEAARFEHVYRQLVYVAHSHFPEEEISFTTGLWDAEEGYKRKVWEDARSSMELDTWPDNHHNYDYIIRKAMQPFWVSMPGGRRQNLVSSENYEKWFDIMQNNKKAAASVLYDLYFGDDDKSAFDHMSKLLSKKAMNDPFSVASYYFFLKNKDEYVTARKEGTGERLARLKLNASCLQKCTWDGYQQYLAIVNELKDFLKLYHPDITLLDAQSFLWMLWMVDYDTPEYEVKKKRILFCNIAWMEYYDHINFQDDKPRYGGSYVSDTGTAFESWNFHRYEDGYYGFVETKYTGGTAIQENANQLHIEKIDPLATGDYIDNVMVVFCAHSDSLKKTVIVGWYPAATVFRYRRQHIDGHMYNITSDHAILLPEILRTKEVPRARDGGFGFGQSNLRYPTGNNAQEFIKDILAYTDCFNESEDVSKAESKAIASLTDEELAEHAVQKSSEPAPKYNCVSTQRKRNPYLPEIAKRRANGVCELCGKMLDYLDSGGRPYLEAHHIIPLADDGADTISNIAALCPNCHRKMHIVNDPDDIEKLKKKFSE